MRIALAQINTVVGDLDGNAERIRSRLAEAKEQQADLVVFPELAVTGYPPEDLLLRPSFVRAAQQQAEELARETRGIVALIGVPWLDRERGEMFATRARDNSCFVAFCNAVGGQDELIFDGHSLLLDEQGRLLARGPGFDEALVIADIEPADAVGRRLRDVRRRSLARDRGEIPEIAPLHVGSSPHEAREPIEP